MWAGRPRAPGCSPLPESLPTGTGLRPFQRPGRSLKADWLDERSTSNGAVRERVEPAHLGGRWFGADGPPSPPPSPRDLQRCLKVRQVRHRAPPRYTKCACGRTLTDHRSQITQGHVPPCRPLQHSRCQGHKQQHNNAGRQRDRRQARRARATCEARAGMAAPPLAISVTLCDERPPQPAAVSAGLSKHRPALAAGEAASSSSWPAMPMLMRRMQSQSV